MPGEVETFPLLHMTGRSPFIDRVADGAGDALYRCRVCGALEGVAARAVRMTGDEWIDRAQRIASKLTVDPIESRWEARGLTRGQIETARTGERSRLGRTPTLAEVAEVLGTSESTLKRAEAELELR